MKRSVPRLLGFFAIVVVSGAALILMAPAVVDPGAFIPAWIPSVLAALLALSALAAWLVRPKWNEHP